jgi:1-acyl-sn-glycerol-3-phosphate acyltransferase
MDFWYNVAKAIVATYNGILFNRLHVEGQENIPSGPKIVVANHALATDGFFIPFVFPEKVHYLVQQDLFTVPVIGKIIALADQIPVMKGRGQEAIENALNKLHQGKTIVLFPEGRLNDGKSFHPAYTGAARLAMESDAPIIPVGFYTPPRYARSMQTKMFGRTTVGSWQFGGHTFMSIGNGWKPNVENYPILNSSYRIELVRNFTEDIMTRIGVMVECARTLAGSILHEPLPEKLE